MSTSPHAIAHASPLQVLIIEDNPTDRLLIASALEDVSFPKVTLTHAERLADGLHALAAQRFDAALLDLNLPDTHGAHTVERLRAAAPELPLVVLTGTHDLDLIARILGQGAQDYVLKQDADGPLLAKAIFYAIERHRVRVELDRSTRERLENEARIRDQAALIDAARDAILVVDLDGKVRFWNKGAERNYGWSSDEVVGRNVREFLYLDAARAHEAWSELASAGVWSGEIRKATRHGKEVLTDTRLTLVRDDLGQPKFVLCISTDITERKKLEHRFLRAQRMESIGSLAGGIAHDLNNVLAPILMAVEMLKARVPDTECGVLLDTVANSARRGADMIRQVLTFARGVEGQRLPLSPKHLLLEIARIFEDTFLKSIRIRTHIAQDVWTIVGDRTQLHQVLMNLGVNARDAMPEGGTLELRVNNIILDRQNRVAADAKLGPYVVFTVTDTGTGIPADIFDKIFDPFFSTKEIGKGTGLGLATVQGIVTSHGGYVTVYSEVGRGTTFKVYLPAAPDANLQTITQTNPSLPRGNGEIILIVDDEASIREITRFTLEAFGYRTLLAKSGPEALATFAERHADIAVVLTDMMMPSLDGAATIRGMKAIHPPVRIIASSGLATESQAAAATAAGSSAFLQKPYSVETLLNTLHQQLRPATLRKP